MTEELRAIFASAQWIRYIFTGNFGGNAAIGIKLYNFCICCAKLTELRTWKRHEVSHKFRKYRKNCARNAPSRDDYILKFSNS